MDHSSLFVAIIYAISSLASGSSTLGSGLGPDQDVPADVRGLFVPDHGVVQLVEGASLRTGAEAGRFVLGAGQVRVVAERPMTVAASDLEVVVGSNSAAAVAWQGARVTVCAERGEVAATLRGTPVEGTDGEDDGQGDTGARRIEPGTCWTPGQEAGADAGMATTDAFRQAAETAAPPPVELPDVVGDLSEQLTAVEDQWSVALEQGPRREAQSCGCSENGGSGGGLDPSGTTPIGPDPEQPDPGRVRVLIRLPPRR